MLAFTTAILSLLSLSAATPAKRATQILYPNAVTAWQVGLVHNVTWTTDASGTGNILLSKGGVVDPNPLASGVSASDGRAMVTVPSVALAEDYAIVLDFGGQTTNGQSFAIVSSGDTASRSVSAGASSASSVSGSVATTVAFPSTTIVTTLAPGSATSAASSGASGASSSVSSAASSLSSDLSSIASSLSSAVSSLSSGASSKAASASSAASTVTSPAGSTSTSAGASNSSAAGAAVPLNLAGLTGAAISVVLMVVSGAFLL